MNIIENASLKSFNTLQLDHTAQYFTDVKSEAELLEALAFANEKNINAIVIGDGSNIVLSEDYQGIVIRNNIQCKEIIAENNETVTIKVGAGENWHNLVEHCLRHQWFGLENLALIPGRVGAAPVQNIGAYGVEVKQFIDRVHVIDRQTGKQAILANNQCDFSYRDSVFRKNINRYVITFVEFILHQQPKPNLSYTSLADALDGKDKSPQVIFDKVVEIRRERLPDPVKIPNAGSFFKNPVVSLKKLQLLQEEYPDIVHFPFGDQYKLAAAWLIDTAGWKGAVKGDVAVFDKQALVLTNCGEAKGKDVLAMAREIQRDILQKFDVDLVIEPVVIL